MHGIRHSDGHYESARSASSVYLLPRCQLKQADSGVERKVRTDCKEYQANYNYKDLRKGAPTRASLPLPLPPTSLGSHTNTEANIEGYYDVKAVFELLDMMKQGMIKH